MFHNRLPFAQVILNLAIMILRVIKILICYTLYDKSYRKITTKRHFIIEKNIFTIIIWNISKKVYLCNAHL